MHTKRLLRHLVSHGGLGVCAPRVLWRAALAQPDRTPARTGCPHPRRCSPSPACQRAGRLAEQHSRTRLTAFDGSPDSHRCCWRAVFRLRLMPTDAAISSTWSPSRPCEARTSSRSMRGQARSLRRPCADGWPRTGTLCRRPDAAGRRGARRTVCAGPLLGLRPAGTGGSLHAHQRERHRLQLQMGAAGAGVPRRAADLCHTRRSWPQRAGVLVPQPAGSGPDRYAPGRRSGPSRRDRAGVAPTARPALGSQRANGSAAPDRVRRRRSATIGLERPVPSAARCPAPQHAAAHRCADRRIDPERILARLNRS